MSKRPARYGNNQRVLVWFGDGWAAGSVIMSINNDREGWFYRVRFDSGQKVFQSFREVDLRPEDAVSRLGEIVG